MTEKMARQLWKMFKKHRRLCRWVINLCHRMRLRNLDFSLIASNCNGCLMLHDLHLKFRTPTVNLWFEPGDFIEFLRDLPRYLNEAVVFSDVLERERGYPVGVLGGRVKVYFTHYKSRREAEAKWRERCARVNPDNLFVLFTDADGCSEADLRVFDDLPYAHKAVFTHRPRTDLQSAVYIRGFERQSSVGRCFDFKHFWSGRKYFDDFDYVRWFNSGKLI